MTTKTDLIEALDEALIVDLTSRLVGIPSENPPGDEAACARFIHDTLRDWGVEAELVRKPYAERPQVVAWHRGRGNGPVFVLNGHMDTVPADPSLWRHPPHEAVIEDGRLYGLGSCDMKGSLANAMAILKALKESGIETNGTLMAQFVVGEETDEPGTRTLLQLGYTGDRAIVMEPTDGQIGPGTRGACWHRVTLTGPACHCGLTDADAPDLMRVLWRFAGEVEACHRRVSEQRHHLLASPGCRITRIRAGETHNSTARSAEMIIDRRMLPHESVDQVRRDLQEMLDGILSDEPGIGADIAFVDLNEATETPLDSPVVTGLQRNIREITGQEPRIWGPPYGCDMRNFVADAGIPTVNYGAGDFRRCHQPDEFVPIADLLQVGRVTFGVVLDNIL
ncbi:M20 family metallopeptidase [Paracoccus methylarcula]|uniref:Peptidase M20 dimerisation domain-containing protein n=1 Tax=Paracoccus methylarcula TaxID=72022 RepID=A0A3R7NW16_9RHOB|nr:M20 family metallopeptidase [Paracoccus methylarcula]RNF33219.1 hypothetical protein A7A09_017450 [Paracoccus methylarcula]